HLGPADRAKHQPPPPYRGGPLREKLFPNQRANPANSCKSDHADARGFDYLYCEWRRDNVLSDLPCDVRPSETSREPDRANATLLNPCRPGQSDSSSTQSIPKPLDSYQRPEAHD